MSHGKICYLEIPATHPVAVSLNRNYRIPKGIEFIRKECGGT